jgi:Rrf2 family protein
MVKSKIMLYSKSAEYAIQAMIYLAEYKSDKPVMTSKISQEYGIPHQFLAKIVQTLVKHRLLKATRGRTGGINLYRNARDIYLHQIVDAIDGPPHEEERCAIGLDLCSDDVPCPIHHTWKPIKRSIRSMLSHENLEELAHRVTEKRNKMRQ